ncbi:MAG TPA: hypothetical protein VHV74_17560 [Pseudonocardiaceae bacterium]|jgi:hypothetical protein|nr:hypothetical protein [Pseudonocardiaceae bacterium]
MPDSSLPFAGPLSNTFALQPGELARMQQQDAASAAAGYTVDPAGLADRVGELRAVAGAVGAAAAALDVSGGDLGPGNLPGAVASLRGQWQDGLGHMRDRIDTMAGAINHANTNYAHVEDAAEQAFTTRYGEHR